MLTQLVVSLLLMQYVVGSWVNEYDEHLQFECPAGQYIDRWKSKHSNNHEDRQFNFRCRASSTFRVESVCSWSGYANEWQSEMNFNCPKSHILTGVESWHSNDKEDRRWKIKCCKLSVISASVCDTTDFINQGDNIMYYALPEGFAITGVRSWFDTNREDRRWKFNVCRYGLVSCNGLGLICKLPFTMTTFPGTHNSGSGFDGQLKYSWGLSAPSCLYRNQDQSLTDQLTMGLRFFDLDMRMKRGKVHACHNTALAGRTNKVFQQIGDFLMKPMNRNEVVVVRISDTWDTDVNKLINELLARFTGTNGNTGLNNYKAKHGGKFPTIQQAVDDDQRVFIFIKDKLCDSSCQKKYNFLISETEHMGDTWKTRGITSGCSGIVSDTRSRCVQYAKKTFVMDSHFGSYGRCISDMADICAEHLRNSVETCASIRSKYGHVVNFLAVDYPSHVTSDQNVVDVANEQNEANAKLLK